MPSPDGKIGHSEIKIGDSVVFISDEFPGRTAAPSPTATPSSSLFLYVEDVDAVYNRAVSAGAKSTMPLQDMFWGDRFGNVVDPFGHRPSCFSSSRGFGRFGFDFCRCRGRACLANTLLRGPNGDGQRRQGRGRNLRHADAIDIYSTGHGGHQLSRRDFLGTI